MYWALLIKSGAAVKVARCAKQVKFRLPIITFIRAIDVGLREDENLYAKTIPLYLGFLCVKNIFWHVGEVE